MSSLIECRDTYTKTSGGLWQYYRNEPALNDDGNTIDFPNDSYNSISFKFKQKITGQTVNNETKDVETMIPLKYLSNFWKTV